jgi:hypothetical protein
MLAAAESTPTGRTGCHWSYICPVCTEKVTEEHEFTLAERNGEKIRTHAECAKKKASPKPAAGIVPVTSRGGRRRR